MSFLYEKSGGWRWIVGASKTSKVFFWSFASLCFAMPVVLGYVTMQATSYNNEQLERQLAKRGREDAKMMTRVNKDRLDQFLGELKRKENTDDRYTAALQGKILTGPPDARIRDSGTSLRPIPQENVSDKVGAAS